jgi:hypothetical protein
MDPAANEAADGAGAAAVAVKRRLPAARIALVVATIVSAACVLYGYSAMVNPKGGCDGGLCGLAFAFGCVAAVVGGPIVFGVVWGLVTLANRFVPVRHQ